MDETVRPQMGRGEGREESMGNVRMYFGRKRRGTSSSCGTGMAGGEESWEGLAAMQMPTKSGPW